MMKQSENKRKSTKSNRVCPFRLATNASWKLAVHMGYAPAVLYA